MRVSGALRARLAEVELIVFDVDGVLTQGDIIYTDQGVEAKAFDVKDGLGLRVASEAGLALAIMTGRSSRVVERRARDLHISDILQRVGDKAAALRTLVEDKGIPLARVCFMGDDLNDREAMKMAGVSIAPADAVEEIREVADLVTDAPGGRGAARQAVRAILSAQDRWQSAVEAYLAGLSQRDRTRREVGK
ncbi:MAG: HAD hydrolase family protein [Thermoleophilia bacterium]|nr:HAD hydrolase family protein [Thermoleophilia bacterium]